MTLVDSEVVFKARCDEIGIGPATFNTLKNRGWATFGSYAFSVTTSPGQPSDGDFDTKIAFPVLPRCSQTSKIAFRELHIDCFRAEKKSREQRERCPKEIACSGDFGQVSSPAAEALAIDY